MTLAYYARNVASAERVRARMARIGLTPGGHKVWTQVEDDFCRLLHDDPFALRQILSHRSPRAIQQRCCKLGFARQYHLWAALNKQKLRRMYPEATREEICAAFPGVSWENIQAVARYYGYRRKKKPYKITGIQALDDVRLNCYDKKINMRELDEDCRTKKYFQTRGYRRKYPSYWAIGRAANVLGGRLEVHWPVE